MRAALERVGSPERVSGCARGEHPDEGKYISDLGMLYVLHEGGAGRPRGPLFGKLRCEQDDWYSSRENHELTQHD